MKAVLYKKYGSPDELEFTDVTKPSPKDDEVLIRIHAASINEWDWGRLKGSPFIYRLISGLFKPTLPILGCDVAGKIEALGKNIVRLKVGDEVFGDLSAEGWGGFAEYVCASEKALELKPLNMTFEQGRGHTASSRLGY